MISFNDSSLKVHTSMVEKTTASFSHSKVKKTSISLKSSKWNAEHKKANVVDIPLELKKVEDDDSVDAPQEHKKDIKDLDLKKKTLRSKAYELFVPSVFSNIFFVSSRISEDLKRELPISNGSKLLTSLDQTIFEETPEASDFVSVENFNSERRTIRKTLTIRIKPNNVFCTLRSEIDFRMVSGSSTKYKVKMSKKTLRYNYKIIVKSFLEETKKDLKTRFLLVCVTAPKRIRRELLRMLKKKLKSRDKSTSTNKNINTNEDIKSENILMFDFYAKKCFNGCRARKKKRNKQRGLRVYK